MPGLPKAKIEIPLGLGLETDIDDKLLPAGKVFRLENAVWARTGEVLKRTGHYALGTQYAAVTPGTMPAPWQLATHKGALVSLSIAGPRPIGVYSPQLTKWIAPAGSVSSDNINGVVSKLRGQVLPQRTTVFRSNSKGALVSEVAQNFATDGTYALVVWVETTASVNAMIRAQMVELSTGKMLFQFNRNCTTINGAVRALVVNNEFRLVFIDGANVIYVTWTLANIAAGFFTASGEFTLDNTAGNFWFDLIASGTDMLVIYNSTTTTKIIKRDSGGGTTVSVLVPQGGGTVTDGVHAWVRDLSGAGKIGAACSSAGQGVRVHWDINTGTGATALSYTIDGAAPAVSQIAAHTISTNATGEFVVLWTASGTTTWGRRVVAGITSGIWIRQATLASMALLRNGDYYVSLVYDSATQGAYFLVRVPTNLTDGVDGNRTPSARYCSGQGVAPQQQVPQPIAALSSDVFLTAQNVRVRLLQQAGLASVFDTGVDLVRFTFNPTNVNRPVEFADNLYACGGLLGAFDGMTFAEEGFHLFPDGISASEQLAGSLEPLGNYRYVAVFRYVDDFGRRRRSAPSDAVARSLSGTNQGVQVGIRTLKLHGHIGILSATPVDKVVIELYRTKNNETEEFRLVATTANDPSVDTVTIVDTQSDAAWAAGEELYTDGGVLEFQSPPPALALATYKDRIALIAADDPTLIWISLPLSETEGPRFNSESSIRIDDSHGDLTGLAAVDDRLIAFKNDAIYTIVGDGPDVDGNGTFGIAQLVATGTGCSAANVRSIVEVPDGVMFRSSSTQAGIFLVNRGLALEYVGKDVQEYLTGTSAGVGSGTTINAAVHNSALLRTEFFTNLGTTLIYDHARKLWSTTGANQNAVAATVWNGRHVYQPTSVSNVAALAEYPNDDRFDDNAAGIEEYIETPWLALNQLKGYERFRRLQLVGGTRIINDASDPNYALDLTIWANYNQNTALVHQTRLMAVTDDPNLTELKYSSKLAAIKVGIRIKIGNGGVNFAGPKLTALVLEYSAKEGLLKTAYTNRTT